jgi:hypothetical protein
MAETAPLAAFPVAALPVTLRRRLLPEEKIAISSGLRRMIAGTHPSRMMMVIRLSLKGHPNIKKYHRQLGS